MRKAFALLLCPCALFGDCFFIRAGTRNNSFTLEPDVARSSVVQLDYGSARGGFAAAGLAHKTEHLAFFNIETDVVDRLKFTLAHFKELAKIFNF